MHEFRQTLSHFQNRNSQKYMYLSECLCKRTYFCLAFYDTHLGETRWYQEKDIWLLYTGNI